MSSLERLPSRRGTACSNPIAAADWASTALRFGGRVLLDLAAYALRQVEEERDHLGVVERAKPFPVFRRHSSPTRRQTRGHLLHLEQDQIVSLRPMLGDAFEKSGHLRDLGRRLALVAIKQEPQDQLEALEVDDIGQRTNRLGVDTLVDERRRSHPQLVFPCLQRRRTSRTRRSVLTQIRARQANEERVDVRFQRSWKVRPRENVDLA